MAVLTGIKHKISTDPCSPDNTSAGKFTINVKDMKRKYLKGGGLKSLNEAIKERG
jgi:hypothetical protein